MARRPTNVRGVNGRTRRVLASLAGIMCFGAFALYTATSSGAASDPAANTVRPINGAPAYGPDPGLDLNANLVGVAGDATGRGYWAAAADGGVFARGDARFFGSEANQPLVGPVVGIASTPSGDGYWLAAADGGVFTFGNATFLGSLGGYRVGDVPLQGAIVGIARTTSGQGYWLLGSDGGVFAFGDARFLGSATNAPHVLPFVSIAATPSGNGYYLLNSDGTVFGFGDAHVDGDSVGVSSTGIAVPANGHGYQVAQAGGGVVGFGGAPSEPAPADWTAAQHPVLAIAERPGGGAWLARGYTPPPPPVVDISQDPFLKCTRGHESDSAGGYHAVSPDGRYRGAYQFLQSTWNNVARAAGRPDLVGVDPAQAAPHDQDELALYLYHQEGAAPWGGRCAGLP